MTQHRTSGHISSAVTLGSLFNASEAPTDPNIYHKNYSLLRKWVNESMDEYKMELVNALFPLLLHSYIDLVRRNLSDHAANLLESFKYDLQDDHGAELSRLASVTNPSLLMENEFTNQMISSKYHVKMSRYSFELLVSFLQNNKMILLLRIINEHIRIQGIVVREIILVTADRPTDPDESMDTETENAITDLAPLKLGHLPPDPWLVKELEYSIKDGMFSQQEIGKMSDELRKMKQEPANDAPSRDDIPLPPPKVIDVANEIRQLQEMRQKMISAPSITPTICSYTLHNTYNTLSAAKLSPDISLLATGSSDSTIRIWNVKGNVQENPPNPPFYRPSDPTKPTRLIGHSGPVYGLSFSSDNKYLLSSSADKTIRLWSLETKKNVAVYKGHNYPVWDVEFGPLGVYFASASHDRTARLWSLDHVFPLRIFVGHSADVDCVRFHPNNQYLLTGSADKTCRLWDVQRGSCVRVFRDGHTGGVLCVAISPDGKLAASGGADKIVCVWDIASGKILKKMSGHAGNVQCLDFSRDSKVLCSGGMDWSVRVWDLVGERFVHYYTFSHSDLAHTFYTKKTAVHCLCFSKSNLMFSVGAFSPTT